MSRILPSPFLSLTVLAVWLLLVGELSAGQLLLGALVAIVLPWVAQRLRQTRARMRSPLTMLKLAGVVLWDIVVSNIQVARVILGPESAIRPGFVWIPLDIRNPHGIATLAGIITMTPGTVSADLSPDRSHLLVHFLNLDDPQAQIDQIKQRYEAPLREIFR
ncbi:Na+/H+ antiporter subunit E [Rehaibacterium terrae]|jgi:multicomponent K+:H+ antiporter subunit E|uniref:Multicomponent K+:H+ antiporter subunit E n=1 Tax=Rehaibacterium terrae TaxID=1341696 RepID=A0A7W7V713_9GAMM|nr:Na+/H+ antiporter subunit E [Rehaibacterium terrae]MBB5014410.1 multicomponent K+:H+ antiporter subunit E [Rehaibacterium terrae]